MSGVEDPALAGIPKLRPGSSPLSGVVWIIVVLCCALPLLWIAYQIAFNPTTLAELRMDRFRIELLGRTLLYSGCVGAIATLLALPAALAIGRGRGILSAGLWFVLPISLLMPSLVIAYGWKQFLRLIGFDFFPAGFCDVARCVWSLATWLWPVPAIVVGLALRRSDPQVQQQALLDGALRRVMLRQVIGPIIASACIVTMLAMQEFAVYEPTGISVVATEVRMVFETGAYSSTDNPIMQILGGVQPAQGSPDQPARAAAAIATVIPMFAAVTLLGFCAWLGSRQLSAAERIDIPHWPAALDAPGWVSFLSWLTVALTLVVPVVSLVLSIQERFVPARIFREFSPQLLGTLLVAGTTGIVAMGIALCASPRLSRGLILMSIISFLIGGQILAIALIRIYNRPWLSWVYDNMPIVVMAYIGRFGWIVLSAAAMTWTHPWRELRDLAAVDGAKPMQTARDVIWPLAWPVLGASAMFVMILSLSEVPATVLINPARPQMLVPMLMTWLHMLRYDPMIEVSLLTAAVVVVLGAIAVALGWMGTLQSRRWARRLFTVAMLLLVVGCYDRSKPEAIWCSTGIGPAQVVYPRGIAYSSSDDSFFIVDREARIQHLDHDGKYLTGWRMPEWANGKPVGLTVGPDGNLYVPDTHYHRVMVYAADGKGPVMQWGSKGMGPGQFIYPTDIAFDSSGEIFVSEYGDNDRIQVFDNQGKYIRTFGKFGDGPGEFSRPQSMVIDGDLVYVTDACNHRLCVFRTDGTFVRNMGSVGSELGQYRFPYGLDMDAQGHLVVCEFGNNRVQVIDKETGKGLAAWGMGGREPGQLMYPWGVAVDKHGRVVAVDAGNNRLQVFEF